jgi:hypothetical protein
LNLDRHFAIMTRTRLHTQAEAALTRERAMVKQSVFAACQHEIERHKWIESEKAGRDIGEAAIYGWIRQHWSGYLRARWLEHLQGNTFWIELDRGDFGLLTRRFQDQNPLLNHIVERLKIGQENLHIILWGLETKQSMDDIRAILEALDINGARIGYRFDA